jgi:hypothetical protein
VVSVRVGIMIAPQSWMSWGEINDFFIIHGMRSGVNARRLP